MKPSFRKPLFRFSAYGLVLAGVIAFAASAYASDNEDIQAYLELFRSDLNSTKITLINEVMRMTEEEGKIFWPLYRKYETELATLGDARLTLIQQFARLHVAGTLGDSDASEIAGKWFALQKKRLTLWKEYHDKISSALSATRATQFVQVEHQISLLVDIGIASQVPLVGSELSTSEKLK